MATKEIEDLRGSLNKLRSQFLLVATAVTTVAGTFVTAIKAYAENETAVNKLNSALKAQGILTAETSTELQNFADQLARQTTFTDEAIMNSQALFATFGFGVEKIKQATEMAANLSVALGVDLRTSTLILGKALQGNEGALSRYGLTLADVERMSGTAAATLNTVEGRMVNLSNRVGELWESMGRLLLPVFEVLADRATELVSVLERLADSFTAFNVLKTIGAGVVQVFQNMGNAFIKLIELIPGMGSTAQTMSKFFNASLDAMQDNLLEFEKTDKRVTDANIANSEARSFALDQEAQKAAEKRQKEIDEAVAKTDQMLVQYMTEQDEMNALREFYSSQESELLAQHLTNQETMELTSHMKRLQKLGLFNEQATLKYNALAAAHTKAEQEKTKRQNEEEELRKRNLESTLNYISTLSTSKNRELAAIGKAAAIAQATMDAHLAFGRALGSAPPPFNFVLAAAALAAGLSNVSKIVGIKMAEGGIVMPSAGGTLATIGEAGSREAVIPLDDPRARDELGAFGSNTIIINAGTLVADRVSVQEFARQIDEELYRLRRQRESVSFD